MNDGEHARRLEGDRELVAAVQASGRDSMHCRELERFLVELLVGTLIRLSSQGRLFKEVKKQCGISLPAPSPTWREDSREVIFMSAAVAAPKFIDVFVLGGRWSPDLGSSLATMAVRAGLYSFVTEYRTYLREEAGRALTEPLALSDDNDLLALEGGFDPVVGSRSPDPERTAVDRDLIERTLRGTDSRLQRMLLLMSDGWTHNEIAQELGLHPEAVSSAVRRLRRTMRAPGHAAP